MTTARRTATRQAAPVRREELLRVARETFVVHGLGASMRQITGAADVDPALLYHHFTSKQDLFEAAIVEPLEQLVALLLDEADRAAGASDAERSIHARDGVEAVMRAMVEAAPLVSAALLSNQELGQRLYLERVAPLFDQLIASSREHLEGWGTDDRDWDLVVPGIFGMCFGLAMDARYRGIALDTDRVATDVARFVIRGVGATPPTRP